MIRRPPRSTQSRSSAASDVYKRQALIGDRADLALGDDRQPDYIGDPLQLGGAARQGDGSLPAHRAVVQIDRDQLAAGKAGVGNAPGDTDSHRRAYRERRRGTLVIPLALSILCIQAEDATVGAHGT